MFYVVRFSIAIFKPLDTNQVLGMAQYLSGALALAESLSPDSQVVTVAMDDKEYQGMTNEVFLCQECYMKPITLAELAESRAEKLAVDHND